VGRGRRDDSLFVFLATLCARGWGDRPLCEARFHRVQNYNNGDARRAHTYRRRARPRPPNTRPAQALDTSAPWRRNFSRGAAAVDRLAEGSFAADAFGSADGLLAATPREILSALSHRFWGMVAALKARFSGLDLDGLIYCTAMKPVGESYWAWLAAQARVKRRKQLGSAPPPDVQRAAVVAIHAAVLETTGYVDRASDDARAASSGAAVFEALRQRDEDLVGRARKNPGAAHLSSLHAQCRALKARLDAAGFGVQCWAHSATPEGTPFLCFQLAKAREAARKRLGQDVSALRVAFAKIRTIFREAADFTDVACADAFDAAAFDALAAADADVLGRTRAPSGAAVAEFPKKLDELVRQHADVVSWNGTARKLVIFDQARFESEVLPRYFNSGFSCFTRQLQHHGFSKLRKSEVDASLPAGVTVYSNTTVADLTKLVRRKSGEAKPEPAPAPKRPGTARQAAMRTHADAALADLTATELRRIMAARGVGPPDEPPATPAPAPTAACDLPVRPPRASIQVCEARRVGEPWRRFASQSDAARAFPEFELACRDISTLINNPSKAKVAVRGRLEARKVTERPAADEASPAPKRPRVQVDAAAAAVAAVAAPPVLAPTAAAGASPKRPRAPSPKSVTPPRVEAPNQQETVKLFNTGRCCGPRDAGGEAGAVRRRRSFAGGLVGQVLRGGRPGGARVGLLAENRRGGARRHRCTAAERRRRRARGSWVVARAAGGHPRGPRGLPVGNGGPSGAREWSLWT